MLLSNPCYLDNVKLQYYLLIGCNHGNEGYGELTVNHQELMKVGCLMYTLLKFNSRKDN